MQAAARCLPFVKVESGYTVWLPVLSWVEKTDVQPAQTIMGRYYIAAGTSRYTGLPETDQLPEIEQDLNEIEGSFKRGIRKCSSRSGIKSESRRIRSSRRMVCLR